MTIIQKINHDIGVLVCWITRKHRLPFSTIKKHPYEVDFCNRCGHIFNTRKVGRTLSEHFKEVWDNSGNQIW